MVFTAMPPPSIQLGAVNAPHRQPGPLLLFPHLDDCSDLAPLAHTSAVAQEEPGTLACRRCAECGHTAQIMERRVLGL